MSIARAAALSLIAPSLIALSLAGCRRPEAPPTEAPASTPAAVPSVNPVLGRADLVAALALAASAHAAGAQPDADAALAGRTFSLKLPFGCFGPAEAGEAQALALVGDGLASWTRSADGRGHVLSLTPLDWTRSPLTLAAGTEPGWDSVDGFWIARPWLGEDVCPTPAASLRAAPTAAAPAAVTSAPVPEAGGRAEPAGTPPGLEVASPARQAPFTAGLAAIRPEGASRLGVRPGQTFSHTVRAPGEAPLAAPALGYRLVLEGRMTRFPGGEAVRCTGDNPNRRPVCIAAAALDRVAFETADGQRLAEWRLDAG